MRSLFSLPCRVIFAVTLLGSVGLAIPAAAQSSDGLKNMGEPVNSPFDEFSPSVTADGRTMVFNSKKLGERYQSLYISTRGDDGAWSTPRALTELNSIYNDEAPYITPDGDLIFFASDRDGSKEMPADERGQIRVSFDIYWSRKNKDSDQWSRPLPVPGGVNSAHHERSPSLDLRTGKLFFARWPFGDFEQSEIFEATYRDGRFDQIEALPESINGGFQEAAFVPALDREHGYYFASRRPGGRGGWDIYYVSYVNGKFGSVEVLDARVNSEANDIYYSVREKVGFLSSDREGGLGRYDIYGIPAGPPPAAVTFEVRDRKSNAPVVTRADVARAGGTVEQQPTDSRGRFAVTANPDEKSVHVKIQQPGYLPFEADYDLAALAKRAAVQKIELVPIEKNVSFDVHAIYFDANESVIKKESYKTLDDLAEFLKTNSGLQLEIIGHTDLHGKPEYNMDLSLKRATAVRDYLAQKGVPASRFQVKGAGFTRPVVNKIGEGFDEQNRRTEFRIIGVE